MLDLSTNPNLQNALQSYIDGTGKTWDDLSSLEVKHADFPIETWYELDGVEILHVDHHEGKEAYFTPDCKFVGWV